jgi:sulfite dehydrogenase (quinone) subunit SoeC
MRPAASVILLTTLIGAGQGLFLALFTVQCYALVGLVPEAQGPGFYAAGSAIALALLAAGLAASFLHLGQPGRAWRSAAQWRTSWLSREVIALPAFMGAVALYGAAHGLGFTAEVVRWPGGVAFDTSFILGAIATLLAFALFACTGMVYACMRFLAEWHSPLTLVNFTLLGGASGFTAAAAFASLVEPALTRFLAGWALILTALAAISRAASLWRNARLKPKSTLQTAIGIKHPTIRQISQGFMGGSFNTREFFHGRSDAWLRGVKWAFLLLAFVLPLVLLALATPWASAGLLMAAFVLQFAGLLAERWFFLAQARHPQNLYYQRIS